MKTSNANECSASGDASNLATPAFSREGQRRSYGLLKELVSQVYGRSGVIGLHGGLPPSDCFPIAELNIRLQDGTTLSLPADVAQQQYNIAGTGHVPLQRWCEAHCRQMHNPPSSVEHATIVTDGSTHALELITSLLLDPGDVLLVEAYSYSHFLECTLSPKECTLVPVPMDHSGILPAELERVAKSLQERATSKLLYTIPTGQNPTGCTISDSRRRAIYHICRQYGLFILEDDPYAYLQFPVNPDAPVPGLFGLKMHSYLSLDDDGRVIRLDSFAKSVAPGLRLGWATAAPAIAERLTMAIQGSSLGGNMISQTIVAGMLEAWGDEGLHRHLTFLQQAYSRRAAAMASAAQEELQGLAEWEIPHSGMFMVSDVIILSPIKALIPITLVYVISGKCFGALSLGFPHIVLSTFIFSFRSGLSS